MVTFTTTPTSTDQLEELLALIQSVSLSPDGAERVVAAARQRAGTLETGTDPSLSITTVIEAASDSDSEDLDTLGVPPDSKSATDSEPLLTTTGNSDTLPLVPTAHNSPKLVLVSEHEVATHSDSVFYVPARDVSGPYYLITKGRALGIIAGWHHASPLVSGVPGAVFHKAKCLTQARRMMELAIDDGNTRVITVEKEST